MNKSVLKAIVGLMLNMGCMPGLGTLLIGSKILIGLIQMASFYVCFTLVCTEFAVGMEPARDSEIIDASFVIIIGCFLIGLGIWIWGSISGIKLIVQAKRIGEN